MKVNDFIATAGPVQRQEDSETDLSGSSDRSIRSSVSSS
jgi:hypothetical protein